MALTCKLKRGIAAGIYRNDIGNYYLKHWNNQSLPTILMLDHTEMRVNIKTRYLCLVSCLSTPEHDINSLWPSDALWWHSTGPTLARVMACFLTAPSHYLNQCWLIVNKAQWYSPEGNFTTENYQSLKLVVNCLYNIFIQISKGSIRYLGQPYCV